MTYQEAVDSIESIGTRSIKNTNEHTRRLLHALGDPDKRIPHIHVAGTNGKGSICAFLDSVMRESGRKSGMFTSPHLMKINERFRIDGRDMSDDEFARVYTVVKAAVDREMEQGAEQPSYFEFLFLMAAEWFAEEEVDIAIFECGMGGLNDATNALTNPLVSVIASISYDHMKYLGNTIPEIAAHKAGIIKPGTPCVYDASNEEASAVIEAKAGEIGVRAEGVKREDYKITSTLNGTIDFSTSFRYDGHTIFSVAANAPYQAGNATVALMVLKVLRETYPEKFGDLTGDEVRAGLLRMKWPGRMDQILPGVYLDGAHNPDGISRFLEAANCILQGERAGLLFSAVNDKDFTEMIRELADGADWSYIYVTEIEGARRSDAGSLVDLFRKAGRDDAQPVADFREAFRMAREKQGAGKLFICGSLYLAGEIEEIIDD